MSIKNNKLLKITFNILSCQFSITQKRYKYLHNSNFKTVLHNGARVTQCNPLPHNKHTHTLKREGEGGPSQI